MKYYSELNQTNMTYIIIYIIGFLISYLWIRNIQLKDDNWTCATLLLTIGVSLLSWLPVILMCLFHLDILFDYLDSKKPPKWL